MRNNIVSALVIAATLGLGGAAIAQSLIVRESTGVITAISIKDHTVTLADGQTYLLPAGYDVRALADGQKVALNWDQVGGHMLIKSLVFTAS